MLGSEPFRADQVVQTLKVFRLEEGFFSREERAPRLRVPVCVYAQADARAGARTYTYVPVHLGAQTPGVLCAPSQIRPALHLRLVALAGRYFCP